MALHVFQELKDWLSTSPTIVAGDFNNSVEWDRPGGLNNFAAVDAFLRQLGLRSVYHGETGEALGGESRDTYFHTKSVDNSFHIDYVYVPQVIGIKRVTVEAFAEWREVSDHAPLVIDTDDF